MVEGPWNVMGHLLSLQWWCPSSFISEVTFNLVPFWVQVHGIPLKALSIKMTTNIGRRLGGVMEVEDPFPQGQMLRSFLRIRVMIDINLPFITGFWVPRRNKGNV